MQGFRSVTFQPADLDLLDTDPTENALEFKMSKREIYQKLKDSVIIERIISKLGNMNRTRIFFHS